MTSENTFSRTLDQLIQAWAAVHATLMWSRDKAEQALIRTELETRQASLTLILTTALEQSSIPRSLNTLSRLYLGLVYSSQPVTDNRPNTTIDKYRRRIFAAICAAVDEQGTAQESVETLTILAQAFMHEQSNSPNSELPERFREHQRNVIDTLWEHLEPILIHTIMTRRWVTNWDNAGVFNNQVSYPSQLTKAKALAFIGFGYILEEIPKLMLDPNRNIAALLATIAHRGIAREYRTLSDSPPRANTPAVSLKEFHMVQDALEQEIVDYVGNQQIGEALWKYVDNQLRPDEQHIIYRRWRDDPPASSTTIATELGEGWSANRVDVAHHRILKKIRRYLQSLEEGGTQ